MSKVELLNSLTPLLEFMAELDVDDGQCVAKLNARFPMASPQMQMLKKQVRKGIAQNWLCDREAAGVRFSRVKKASDARVAENFSVDAVHMNAAGPGHTHPQGEFDLCFAVSGEPLFDGNAEGWTVYGKNTWHEPTVSGGVMDILYFLPKGEMRFEKKPA